MNEHLRQDAAIHGGDGLEQRASRTRALLYSRSEDGHRAAFIGFFSRLLGGERVGVGRLVTSARPVLFLMIEEAFWLYVLLAVGRAMLGRRTAGFLFRPQQALSGQTLRLRTKRALLRLMRRIPRIVTLTILPFAVEPRFAEIADGWIDDPQQWDLSEEDLKRFSQLKAGAPTLKTLIRAAAGKRSILCAIGRQDRDKGFDQFANSYIEQATTRQSYLFAVGGRVSNDLKGQAEALVAAGGVVIDRRIDDAELLELYAAADIVWCCYSPGYDQSSGILGRAAQLGIPVLVRSGSLLQKLCENEGIGHLVFGAGRLPVPEATDTQLGWALRNRMRSRSVARLITALGTSAAQ